MKEFLKVFWKIYIRKPCDERDKMIYDVFQTCFRAFEEKNLRHD